MSANEMGVTAEPSPETRPLDLSAKPVNLHSRGRAGAGLLALAGMGLGGAVGTLAAGSLAAVAAIGTSLALPGVGIVIAGPIAAGLAGAGAGGIAGGILGGLAGLVVAVSRRAGGEER